MASSNHSSSSANVPPRPEREPRAETGLAPSRALLTAAFAQALDLAEGRAEGHAGRVCYIALHLARAAGRPVKEQRVTYYAALLHDAGAAPASAAVCRDLNLAEEAIFADRPGQSPQQLALQIAPGDPEALVDALRDHPEQGATIARDLGFDGAVQRAIAEHHERWDGHGYPQALRQDEASVPGRLVAAADLIDSLIAVQPSTLAARRNLIESLADHAGTTIKEELSQQAIQLMRGDEFWLGLHEAEVPGELAGLCPEPSRDTRSADGLVAFAQVFARLADAKGEHTAEHSDRTGEIARRIAELDGLDEERCWLVQIAGLVHDVGLLGVPARIIAKPDILSLSEMEAMRKHPTYSQMVLESLAELAPVAEWVGAHHERPDGKGYPEMLEEETIPLEGRILALADTYVALTSTRPYRRALSEEDAQQVLLGGAGTQLDARLVQLLCAEGVPPTSSRSARRSRRTR